MLSAVQFQSPKVQPVPATALRITAQDDDTVNTANGVAEGIETITITLGNLPSGYTAGATSTLTVSIQDEENTPPTGTVTIDTTSPKIGDTLTATTSFTGDKDGHNTFDGDDDTLNTSDDVGQSVTSGERCRTVPSNPSVVQTGPTFDVTATQAGKAIAVRAGFTDDSNHSFARYRCGNYIQSANTDAVKVSVTVTVSTTTDQKRTHRSDRDGYGYLECRTRFCSDWRRYYPAGNFRNGQEVSRQ